MRSKRATIVFLLLIITLAAGLAPARAAATPTLQILLPLYAYPTTWDAANYIWDDIAAANDDVPITAIINPDNGPQPCGPNPDYVTGMTDLRVAGVTMIGYVSTQWGGRDIMQVKTDIQTWQAFYDVDGIFLDETSSNATDYAYYEEVYNYILAQPGLDIVVLNPGTSIPETYVSGLPNATAVIFEDTATNWDTYTPASYVSGYANERFATLIHTAPVNSILDDSLVQAVDRNIEYVYITDDVMSNPWDQLPAFWDALIAAIKSINTADGWTQPSQSGTYNPKDSATCAFLPLILSE